MKITLLVVLMISSLSAFAAGGFTWLGDLSISLKEGLNFYGLNEVKSIEHVVTVLFTSVIFLIGGFVYRMKTASIDDSLVPDNGFSYRNVIEALGEFIYNLAKNTMGEQAAKRYFPLLIFYFTFIFFNNLFGLIPGFLPPTENFNTAFAMGILMFIIYNWEGIKAQGLWGHIKHFAGPMLAMAPLIFVLEIISHAMRPLTLGLRLHGNMLGDHTVLGIFSDLVPLIVPIPFYCLGMFVCFMQAFVFTLLSMIYIGMAVETHDHEEDHAH